MPASSQTRMMASFAELQDDPGLIDSWGRMLAVLQHLGVSFVQLSYSGSGDEGQIDEAEVQPQTAKLWDGLIDCLYDLADSAAPSGYDQNAGGFGTVDVDVAAGTVMVRPSWNESEEVEENEGDPVPIQWGPHDMALAPPEGAPYPFAPTLRGPRTLPEDPEARLLTAREADVAASARDQELLQGIRESLTRLRYWPEGVAAGYARFFRAFAPRYVVRAYHQLIYAGETLPEHVADALYEAWQRPPLLPRPLPRDPLGWALLLLRVAGETEMSLLLEFQGISYGGALSVVPREWTGMLVEELLDPIEAGPAEGLVVRADPASMARGEAQEVSFWTREWSQEGETEVVYQRPARGQTVGRHW